MSQTVLVGTITGSVRQLTDTENSDAISDAFMLGAVNRAYQYYHLALVESFESRYRYSSWDYFTTANQQTAPGPSDMLKLYQLWMYPASGSTGNPVRLERFHSNQETQLLATNVQFFSPWTDASAPFYEERQGTFYFAPIPTTARGLRFHFAPVAPVVSSSLQTVEVPVGFEDFVAARAARDVMVRLGRPELPAIRELLQDAQQRLDSALAFRNVYQEPSDDDGSWKRGWGW